METFKDLISQINTLPSYDGGDTGFDALLGGVRFYFGPGEFLDLEQAGFFWTSSFINSNTAWNYAFESEIQRLERGLSNEQLGISCRCVKD